MVKRSCAAVAIVWKNQDKSELALIKRRTDYPHQLSGKWFFPGGRVEAGEDPALAALRETEEECKITYTESTFLDSYQVLESWYDEGEKKQRLVHLFVYEGIFSEGKISKTAECDAAKWIKKAELPYYLVRSTNMSHISSKLRKLLNLD